MADQGGAYGAGAKTREFFSSPEMQRIAAQSKRQVRNTIFPGFDLIAAGGAAASDFVRGIVGAPQAVRSASVVAAAQPKAKPASSLGDQSSALSPAIAKKVGNPSFADLATMIASANGGKVSLRQLSALSDIAYKTSPRESVRTPTYKDIVGNELLSRSQELLMAEQAKAQELMKTDPAAGQAYGKAAVSRYIGNLQQIMGADPLEQAYAEQIAAQQQGE